MRKLEGELLQPFRKAVSKGAGAIMTSYNKIDGIPATGHRYLLNDVLRGKWGFNGFVCSDLFSIDGMVNSTAANKIGAGAKSLKAGVDMDLGAACYGNKLEEAVKALVHKVVQSGSGIGGFQKVVDGSQDVLVCAIACQYEIGRAHV